MTLRPEVDNSGELSFGGQHVLTFTSACQRMPSRLLTDRTLPTCRSSRMLW
jgi:hypothetical protein